MNSMSQTKIFEPVNKIFKLSESILNPMFSLEPYIVDFSMYDYLAKLYRGYKFPLAKETIRYIESQNVLPLLFGDPKETKTKKIMFSSAIPGFLKQYKKSLVSFVDVSPKASFVRNKITKVPEFFKIEERSFYTFMQTGMLNKLFHEQANSFQYNAKFIKAVAEIYAFLLQKCISSVYPVTSTVSEAEILTYICAVYCLQNFFDLDIDKARATALTIKGIEKSNIANNCHYYLYTSDDKIDMRATLNQYDTEGNQKIKIYPLDIFVNILSAEFPYIKSGHMEARTLQERYTSMYGQNSLFAIEHFFSFFSMLISSTMRINMYSDILLEKSCGSYVDDFYKMILNIS